MTVQIRPEYAIRYFRESDWKDLYEYLSLSEIYKYEPGSPITLDRAKEIAKEREKGTNFIGVIDKELDKLIGHFSFFPSGPEYIRTFDLGFIFNPAFQRKGLATESGMAFVEYCFKHLHIHKVTANCNPCNESSWKLLERLGFTREGYLKKNIYFKEEDGKPLWIDTFVYGLLNSDE